MNYLWFLIVVEFLHSIYFCIFIKQHRAFEIKLFYFLFRKKGPITDAEHQRMFILQSCTETQKATDEKGSSFTHILSSVCKENRGAVPIQQIAK